jgi:hypothetical protein
MDTNLIYLIYLLILVALTGLIWVFIRQGRDANKPHNGMGNGKFQELNHQPVKENGEE